MSGEPAGRRDLPGPGDLLAEQAVARIHERSAVRPAVAVVTGSGLGDAVEGGLAQEAELAFGSLPGFPRGEVPGHRGRLVLGELFGVPAAVFLGRIHLYEGSGVGSVTMIPRVAAALGADVLVLTNASGALDPAFGAGDLVVVTDHLNFLGVDPLSGWRLPDGAPAFTDLSAVYDARLIDLAERSAREAGVELRRGVYAAMPGPSYETPAQTAFLRLAGAQVVGMSTVPEAVAARTLGMRVLALSCVTNVAGTSGGHQEVLEAARRALPALRGVLARVTPALRRDERGPGEPDHEEVDDDGL